MFMKTTKEALEMKAYVYFWNIQKMTGKHKFVKVYGKGDKAYILYKGAHIPLKALVHKGYNELLEMDEYKFNIFSYFYELDNE